MGETDKKPRAQITAIIERCGAEIAQKLLQETQDILARGGMLLTDQSDQSFWELLRMNIGYQKNQLLGFPKFPNLFLISLTSIMPVLVMGIRWPASFGDINAVGNALTNLMSHVLHAIFLAACLYVSFDPPISPRRAGFGIPMLPFYYLAALSVGYYSEIGRASCRERVSPRV